MSRVACVDVGSTFTKAALVELGTGRLVGTASHPTTIATDVLDGVDACLREMGAGQDVEVRVCSSAGGGLRLAVIGYERVVTAEAARRVGLSAGARVVHVGAGRLDAAGMAELAASRPDILLLAGGTDGGNAEVLVHNAAWLAGIQDGAPVSVPVVVAGNVEARAEVVGLLLSGGAPVLPTANVLPRIGVLDPRPARVAIREVFIRHVIGGKGLSRSARFARLVRAATPDAVLAGVELLADGAPGVPGLGDLLVVDVGGATTDVYSVISPDHRDGPVRPTGVVEVLWRARTVEGDLGVRWGAPGVVDAAGTEHLLGPHEEVELRAAAEERVADPGLVPVDAQQSRLDARLGVLAATVALRRHARPARDQGDPGRDLQRVRLVLGSGGVFRHADPEDAVAMLVEVLGDVTGGWRLPERARVSVDARSVLAAAGLLAADQAPTAARLLAAELAGTAR
ncbi:MAG: glutamate mutase L, partial [Actinomycetes bacterium]